MKLSEPSRLQSTTMETGEATPTLDLSITMDRSMRPTPSLMSRVDMDLSRSTLHIESSEA